MTITTPTATPPKMKRGESETTFRRRMQDWEREERGRQRNEQAHLEGAANWAREKSLVAKITARAKAAAARVFDKSTVGGTMAAMIFDDRVEAELEYAKLAKKVAQAGDAAKQTDKTALAKAALELAYAPARVEHDLSKLRKYFARKPELDDLIERCPALEQAMHDANTKVKAAEQALADAKAEQATARGQATRASTASVELQQLEAACGSFFATRDQLLAQFAADEQRQAEAIRRQPIAGVGYAV